MFTTKPLRKTSLRKLRSTPARIPPTTESSPASTASDMYSAATRGTPCTTTKKVTTKPARKPTTGHQPLWVRWRGLLGSAPAGVLGENKVFPPFNGDHLENVELARLDETVRHLQRRLQLLRVAD